MNGILVIDKPEGMTSHDVVDSLRAKFSISKVGHLGTLDPMATGVLPVCTGKATRIGQYIPSSPKEYIGEIRFGFSTNTYDREGIPASEPRPLKSSAREIEDAIGALTGKISQVPPPFSAKKIGGVASYKLARKGRMIEASPVPVEVHKFEITALDLPLIQFRVICSAGTYIRSLAYDLGQKLGCGAHLTALRRTMSGEFRIEQAVPLGQVSSSDLIPMEMLLASWPLIEVSDLDQEKVLHGNQIPGGDGTALARIFNKKGEFIAVAAVENGWVCPKLVLTSLTSD